MLLSGCWLGDNLFAPADAQSIVPPGRYRMSGTPGSAPGIVSIIQLPNGMMRLQGDDEPGGNDITFGVTPFPGRPGLFITWVEGESRTEGFYGVLRRETGGGFAYYMPSCHRTQELVRAAGGQPTGDGGTPSCRFPNRAALETALRRFSDGLGDLLPMHFVPVPHG